MDDELKDAVAVPRSTSHSDIYVAITPRVATVITTAYVERGDRILVYDNSCCVCFIIIMFIVTTVVIMSSFIPNEYMPIGVAACTLFGIILSITYYIIKFECS